MVKSEPLDEIQWKSPEWIQQFGLHTENVLDYFSESPFYDRTSNNQVIKMQFQFQAVPPNVHPKTYMQNKLLEMVGTEFIIAFVKEPDFWVIRKQKRLNPRQVKVQQDYYIIGANIYQAPKVHDILSSRLLSTIKSVKQSLDVLNNLSTFNVANGHSYPTTIDEQPSNGNNNTNNNSNNNNTVANTVTPMIPTPSVSGGGLSLPTAASNTNINTNSLQNPTSRLNEIPSSTFDSLLNTVMNSNEHGTYLEDVPLYGKGSTVEKMDLKINLDDDI